MNEFAPAARVRLLCRMMCSTDADTRQRAIVHTPMRMPMFALLPVWGWGWPPDGLGGGVGEGECKVEENEDADDDSEGRLDEGKGGPDEGKDSRLVDALDENAFAELSEAPLAVEARAGLNGVESVGVEAGPMEDWGVRVDADVTVRIGLVVDAAKRLDAMAEMVEAVGRGEDDVVYRKVAKVLMRVLERNGGPMRTAMGGSFGCDGSEQLQVPSQSAHAGGRMNPPI